MITLTAAFASWAVCIAFSTAARDDRAVPSLKKRDTGMASFNFDHIHLFSRNPEATASYYEKMFAAQVTRSMVGGKPRIDMKLGGANIFILDVSADPKAVAGAGHPHLGLDHFGLEVKGIDAVCAELKAKGAVFTRGPETIRPGTRIAFLTGPEGVSIELLERTPV